MRTKFILFVLKQAVKYLSKHPDLIPGEIDDAVVRFLARHLGV
ncbi:hypothetical protein SEA_PAINTERBOY_10 [Mycobacterium phage PainterBoy]|nr:hypothetical protein SEA_LUCYEDI_10 [Mycobacterium phage Lucyedi]QNJ55804.1 hypothetical protein SEA_PAINTERBOY_10 [Mycobacterium phage PainterBoy]